MSKSMKSHENLVHPSKLCGSLGEGNECTICKDHTGCHQPEQCQMSSDFVTHHRRKKSPAVCANETGTSWRVKGPKARKKYSAWGELGPFLVGFPEQAREVTESARACSYSFK